MFYVMPTRVAAVASPSTPVGPKPKKRAFWLLVAGVASRFGCFLLTSQSATTIQQPTTTH